MNAKLKTILLAEHFNPFLISIPCSRVVTRLVVFLFVLLIPFFVTSCTGYSISPTVAVDFYRDNYWRSFIQVRAPASLAAKTPELESRLNQIVQTAIDSGIDISQEKEQIDTEVVYTLQMSGSNYQQLSNTLFQNQLDIRRIDSNGRQKIYIGISDWEPLDDIGNINLLIRGGQFLSGDGQVKQSDNWGGDVVSLTIYANSHIDLAITPISCLTRSASSVNVAIYENEGWISTINFNDLATNCDLNQIQNEFSILTKLANENGIANFWESAASTQDPKIQFAGKGLDWLSKIIFDDQADIHPIASNQSEYEFNLAGLNKTGYGISTLTLEGREFYQSNGSQTDTNKIQWDTNYYSPSANFKPLSYLNLADATLIIDFLTGQKWDARIRVRGSELSSIFESELQRELSNQYIDVNPYIITDFSFSRESQLFKGYIDYSGESLQDLERFIFKDTASFIPHNTGWARTISYYQFSTLHTDFNRLRLILRGGKFKLGNGELANDPDSFITLPINQLKWKSGQVMSWENLDDGNGAQLTERFKLSFDAVLDVFMMRRAQFTPLWIVTIVILFSLILFISIYRIHNKLKAIREEIPCTNCKFIIPSDAYYCPRCGKKRRPILFELLGSQSGRGNLRSSLSQFFSKIKSTSYNALSQYSVRKTSVKREAPSTESLGNRSDVYIRLNDGRIIDFPPNGGLYIGLNRNQEFAFTNRRKQIFKAEILPAKKSYYLQCLFGDISIMVNGNQLTSKATRLENMDLIKVGDQSFSFHHSGEVTKK